MTKGESGGFVPPKESPEMPGVSDDELLADYLSRHPEAAPKPDNYIRRESGPEVEQYDDLIAQFEINHPLDELFAIVDLPMEVAREHPVREPARQALAPISKLLDTLREETDISPEKLTELEDKWRKISDAVGYFNRGVYSHKIADR